MKIYSIILSAFIITFSSCSKSEEEENILEKNYIFNSITWSLEEDDYVTTYEDKLFTRHYSNPFQTPIYETVSDIINETSNFEYEDPELPNKFIEKGTLISVPTDFSMLSSNPSIVISNKYAPLLAGTEKEIESPKEISNTLTISSLTKLTYSGTYSMKRMRVTYTMSFINEMNNSDILKVKGKWTGLLYNGLLNTTIESNPYED